jgi:hypothetical protein
MLVSQSAAGAESVDFVDKALTSPVHVLLCYFVVCFVIQHDAVCLSFLELLTSRHGLHILHCANLLHFAKTGHCCCAALAATAAAAAL